MLTSLDATLPLAERVEETPAASSVYVGRVLDSPEASHSNSAHLGNLRLPNHACESLHHSAPQFASFNSITKMLPTHQLEMGDLKFHRRQEDPMIVRRGETKLIRHEEFRDITERQRVGSKLPAPQHNLSAAQACLHDSTAQMLHKRWQPPFLPTPALPSGDISYGELSWLKVGSRSPYLQPNQPSRSRTIYANPAQDSSEFLRMASNLPKGSAATGNALRGTPAKFGGEHMVVKCPPPPPQAISSSSREFSYPLICRGCSQSCLQGYRDMACGHLWCARCLGYPEGMGQPHLSSGLIRGGCPTCSRSGMPVFAPLLPAIPLQDTTNLGGLLRVPTGLAEHSLYWNPVGDIFPKLLDTECAVQGQGLPAPPVWPVVRLSNIPWDCSIPDIEALFQPFQIPPRSYQAQSIHILMDRMTGKTLSDAYVELLTDTDAERAVLTRNQRVLKGRIVTCMMSTQRELLSRLFPEWKGAWQDTGVVPNEQAIADLRANYAGFLTRDETNSIVLICRNYKLHFSRKCAERPFEHIISILVKLPWHQPGLIAKLQRDHIFEMLKLAIESLTVHQKKDYNRISNTLLKRMVWAGVMVPAFTERQKQMLLSTALMNCPPELEHHMLPQPWLSASPHERSSPDGEELHTKIDDICSLSSCNVSEVFPTDTIDVVMSVPTTPENPVDAQALRARITKLKEALDMAEKALENLSIKEKESEELPALKVITSDDAARGGVKARSGAVA